MPQPPAEARHSSAIGVAIAQERRQVIALDGRTEKIINSMSDEATKLISEAEDRHSHRCIESRRQYVMDRKHVIEVLGVFAS
jgi:hypothetical protein